MRVRLLFAIVIGLLAAPCPAPAQDAAWPLYRNEKFGFEFRHPPAFAAGAYRDELPADLKALAERPAKPGRSSGFFDGRRPTRA
ncbi:MAG: hypothetical protein HY615_12850 [Candidatus Rokubacteria bacterium]|nr:hypothetical protein [Candidatus Rokubacteria bacterium]MBI4271216.1 hypothetical protein [Candidatus Rokubacteria bacterium]